ncbi:hypothetical protein PV328_005547 [Microctonus aethiopoides]|uniref:Adenylyl cyclase-associated protein n=1 Tax=Microctonus aethiopoides TaxID=144406 RepID=A0AA39FM64_9HYME|nr:hypothetical protein PV328_005547 [Microctonus aethiopoides]
MFSCCMCNKNTKKEKTEENNIDEINNIDNAKIVEQTIKIQSTVLNSTIENLEKKLIIDDNECLKKLNGNALTGEEKSAEISSIISDKKDENFQANYDDKNIEIKNDETDKSYKYALENGMIGQIAPLSLSQQQPRRLYEAPAYIERRIVAGPDEDGDDSVFESSIADDPPVTVNNSTNENRPDRPMIHWVSQEDDNLEDVGGMQEPPATPVAKDELALRRHRFFSDLINASKNSAEHRVRFDPLGPLVHSGDNDREEHLEQLVTRLENVTRRLESVPTKFFAATQEIAIQTQSSSPKRGELTAENNSIVEQVKELDLTVTTMSVAGYDDLVAGPVKEYLELSQKIGGDIATHSNLVKKAFEIQRDFIRTAATRTAPTNQSEQVALLGPTSSQIQLIQEYRENNRGSKFFNHLSAISESIPALGWVAVSPTPAPYIKEMNDAGQFYTNRVLKDWKEKDKTHVEWCKTWVQTLSELQKYVRQYHTTGLVWAKTGSAPVPPPPCAMPPPPPCMPVGDVSSVSANDDRSALFAQINRGEDITKSLKKVTADMQTHKNTSLRTGPAPFKAPIVNNSGGSPMKTVPPANAPIDKPPVFSRDGKKWLVEYQKGNRDLLIENAEMNNVVYMYRCQDSQLVIKGKINSVVIDSCRKSSIVFDSLVSSIEFVNCQSVQMQVLGKVPTISIDKTDGCQMYLNSNSLDVALISSKSSEMNIMVPKGNGDYMEYPVPEQFKTTISPKGLSTCAVDSLG